MIEIQQTIKEFMHYHGSDQLYTIYEGTNDITSLELPSRRSKELSLFLSFEQITRITKSKFNIFQLDFLGQRIALN